MSRILFALALLVVVVLGLGFYLGWFHFSAESTDHKSNTTFTIDQDKIREDGEKVKEKVQEAGQQVKERVGARTETKKSEETRP